MTEALTRAITAFSDKNGKKFPTTFIIYRDGVGEA
jgi:hypothetical protein